MGVSSYRLFLLSPAHSGGRRAQLLLSGQGRFGLAERFRSGHSVSLGEAFSFVSGLYFRGKLAYAVRFSRAPAGQAGVMVITSNRGLLPPERDVTLEELRDFGSVEITPREPRYRLPLEQDVSRLAQLEQTEFVLLGSVASDKYADVLVDVLGERLLFPVEFVGRGDMSRGALLLRAAASGKELDYQPLLGAVRRGRRAPGLSAK